MTPLPRSVVHGWWLIQSCEVKPQTLEGGVNSWLWFGFSIPGQQMWEPAGRCLWLSWRGFSHTATRRMSLCSSSSLPMSASHKRSKHPFKKMFSTCKCHIHLQDEATMSSRLSPSLRIVQEIEWGGMISGGDRNNCEQFHTFWFSGRPRIGCQTLQWIHRQKQSHRVLSARKCQGVHPHNLKQGSGQEAEKSRVVSGSTSAQPPGCGRPRQW